MLVGVTVSLLTPPVEEEALTRFYRQLRPFGVWGPYASCLDNTLRDKLRRETIRDLANMVIAVVWQTTMFMSVVTFVMHKWTVMVPTMAITVALSVVLYATWYRQLPPREAVRQRLR